MPDQLGLPLIRSRGVSLRQQAFRPPCSPPLSLQVRANGLLLGPRSPLSKRVCVRLPIMAVHRQCDWPRSFELVASALSFVHLSISSMAPFSGTCCLRANPAHFLGDWPRSLELVAIVHPQFIAAFPQRPRSQELAADERTLLIPAATGLVLLNLLPSSTLSSSRHFLNGLVRKNLLPTSETCSSSRRLASLS